MKIDWESEKFVCKQIYTGLYSGLLWKQIRRRCNNAAYFHVSSIYFHVKDLMRYHLHLSPHHRSSLTISPIFIICIQYLPIFSNVYPNFKLDHDHNYYKDSVITESSKETWMMTMYYQLNPALYRLFHYERYKSFS